MQSVGEANDTLTYPLLVPSLIIINDSCCENNNHNNNNNNNEQFLTNFKNSKNIHVYTSENVSKMKNSLLAIFAKIWPITLYYSTGTLAQFLSTFKNSKKIQF